MQLKRRAAVPGELVPLKLVCHRATRPCSTRKRINVKTDASRGSATWHRKALLGAVCIAAVIGASARFLWLHHAGLDIDWPVTIEAFSNIAQTLALLIAGIWTYRLFIKQRIDTRRAEVTLTAAVVARDDEQVLIRAVLELKNIGNVEFRPHKADLHVQDIKRPGSPLKLPTTSAGAPCHPHQSIEEWPEVIKCALELSHEDHLTLEPGESERYPVDFSIPAALGIIQLRATVDADTDEVGDYWDDTIIFDIQKS